MLFYQILNVGNAGVAYFQCVFVEQFVVAVKTRYTIQTWSKVLRFVHHRKSSDFACRKERFIEQANRVSEQMPTQKQIHLEKMLLIP